MKLGALGACETVAAVLRKWKGVSAVAALACRAARTLTIHSADNKVKLGAAGAYEAVARVLVTAILEKEDLVEENVAVEGCGAVACLAFDDYEIDGRFFAMDADDAVNMALVTWGEPVEAAIVPAVARSWSVEYVFCANVEGGNALLAYAYRHVHARRELLALQGAPVERGVESTPA